MSVEEFKAWLEGYSESFATTGPTLEQWIKIKSKINQLGVSKLGNRFPMIGQDGARY